MDPSPDHTNERTFRCLVDPGELAELSADELLALLRPLLRAGGMADPLERFERVAPNIPGVCTELATEWRQNPMLTSGRPVAFPEYLAACLCTRLHQLEQEQYPDLYDEHRTYRPERGALPLYPDPSADKPDDPADEDADTPEPAFSYAFGDHEERSPWRDRLQSTMNTNGIAQPSQAALLSALTGLENGTVTSPYRFSRQLGHTIDLARYQPATNGYKLSLEILELNVIQTATAVATGP